MTISVKEAIQQLGGADAVSGLTGAPVGSVHQWSSKSRVGPRYYHHFLDACKKKRISVDREEVMRGPAANDRETE